MALSPKNVYAANQIDITDPVNYPEGKAKNISAPGNVDGTPFEKQLVNDIWGFLQHLLANSGEVPNGVPDNAQNSQYFNSIRSLLAPNVTVITTLGDVPWSLPDWVSDDRIIEIHLIGPGGGGSSGFSFIGANYRASQGGSGGGAGHYNIVKMNASTFRSQCKLDGKTVTVNVGAGGVGGAATVGDSVNGNDGGVGGLTSCYFGPGADAITFFSGKGMGGTNDGGGAGKDGGGGGAYYFTGTPGTNAAIKAGGAGVFGSNASLITQGFSSYGDFDVTSGALNGGVSGLAFSTATINAGEESILIGAAPNSHSPHAAGVGSVFGGTVDYVGGGVGGNGETDFWISQNALTTPILAGDGGDSGNGVGSGANGGNGYGAGGGGGGGRSNGVTDSGKGGDGADGVVAIIIR